MKEKIREFKKNQIIDEAVALISNYGFHLTTMDRLCENLNVSKPFLYSYFENKNALLIEIYDRMITVSADGVNAILEERDLPERKVRKIAAYLTKANIDLQGISAIYMQEEKNLPEEKRKEIRRIEHNLDEKFTRLIQSGVDDGVFDVEHPRIAAFAIFSMARWVHRWYRADRLPADVVASEMGDYALNLLRYKKR